MAHVAAATAFRNDDLEITADEGEKLSEALKKVLRHYNIPDVASETKDWIGLIIAAATVYAPRLSASYAERKIREAKDRAEKSGDNVLNMTIAH